MNSASQNFMIPIFPSSKLLLKKSGREMIRIAKFANGKNMQLMQSGPGGIVVEAFTGFFSVFESAKVIVLCKFSLKSGPLYAILREKTNFTD